MQTDKRKGLIKIGRRVPFRFIGSLGGLLELGGGNFETLLGSLKILFNELDTTIKGSAITFGLKNNEQ